MTPSLCSLNEDIACEVDVRRLLWCKLGAGDVGLYETRWETHALCPRAAVAPRQTCFHPQLKDIHVSIPGALRHMKINFGMTSHRPSPLCTLSLSPRLCLCRPQWVTFVSSIAQLIAIPSLSGASDVVGRRLVLITALAVNGAVVLALGINVNSIVACVAAQVVTGVCGVVLPVSQAIIIDLAR